MFKKFVCLLAISFSLCAGEQIRGGADIAGYAVKAQQEGIFREDLDVLDSCYCEKRKNHEYDKALNERKEAAKAHANVSVSPTSKKRMEFGIKKADLDTQLASDVHAALSQVSDARADSIKKSVAFEPSHVQATAIEYYDSLKYKFLGEGRSPLESELIRLHIEHSLKQLEMSGGSTFKKKVLSPEFHATVELNKWEAMQEAALRNPKEEVAKHVFALHAMAPLMIAKRHDMAYLSNLGKGNVSASLEWEQKLQGVMKNYFSKLSALEQQYLNQ